MLSYIAKYAKSANYLASCPPIQATVQKLEENQKKNKKKNKKNNPVRRILGKSIQDCFFLVFFVYLVFLEVFAVPSPTVQKLEENQKNKKNNPVRRILGKSIQDCFFGLFGFSRGFCCPKPNCPKTRGKPKNKKTNPVRRILGKSIQDWFFLFFLFIWFFSRFLLSQAQMSKNSRQQNYLCRKT